MAKSQKLGLVLFGQLLVANCSPYNSLQLLTLQHNVALEGAF